MELIGIFIYVPSHGMLSSNFAFEWKGDNVRARRMFFCNEIGIGLCDGSILVKQLNRWGFTWNDITEAAKESERRLAEWLEAKEREIALEASKLDYSESSEDEPI